MATIRDIAKACGVSAMTVSAVLNKRQGAASAETRERILRVVDELGYHPNAVARALTRRYMDTIGVVLVYRETASLTGNRYFGPVLDGICDSCKLHRQRALIITEESWEEACENLPSYFDGHCDGLLFVLPTVSDEFLVAVQRQNIPFVIIGEHRSVPSLSVADLDNVAAGYDATSYLISVGHRRIAHFKGNSCFLSSTQREDGLRKAFEENNLPIDETLILDGHYSKESGSEQVEELIARCGADMPTAIFCGDDWIALGALDALQKRGLRVPEDVSIIGVNNDTEGAVSSPPLTTIDHPLRVIGRNATDVVLGQIRDKSASGEKRLTRGQLIVRGSVSGLNPTN